MSTVGLLQPSRPAAVRHPAPAPLAAPAPPRRARRVHARAAERESSDEATDDGYVMGYVSLNPDGTRAAKKTLGELEADFLEAMRAYYFDEAAAISNEEFDNLKQELTWEGSQVVVLSANELRFLEAKRAFEAGRPVMSDADYEALKRELKQAGSAIAIQGPR